jgi:type I restriction enzyme S subunit
MKKMPIPIPSIGEQRQIAMALREQMRIAEDAREAAKEELLTIDALPAALMRRALGGDF